MMSSRTNNIQEFPFFDISESRNKIDGFWQKEENSLQPDSKYDLRRSLAWDSAFLTSPGILEPEELFENLKSYGVENGEGNQLYESNARRSLAWDNAFFTSAGVLNPEELSLVNKGYKKSDAQGCQGIKEFCRSTDSNTTIGSSDYSLASLEIELFDDTRASQPVAETKKQVSSSRIGVKSMPVPRWPTDSMKGAEKNVKDPSIRPRVQHAGRSRELSASSSSLKLCKAFGKANLQSLPIVATNRSPLSKNQATMETKIKRARSGQNVSKKSCIGGSRTAVPSLTPPLKSASPGSLSYSNHSSKRDGAPIGLSMKTPSSKVRQRDGSILSASSVSSRTHIASRRGKNGSVISSVKGNLFSTPTSSCTTPSSSIDEPSAESTLKGRPGMPKGAPLDDVSRATNARRKSNSRAASKENKPTNKQFSRFPDGMSSPPSVSRNTKPSGLRMPSPKIGFFDMENPLASSTDSGLKLRNGVTRTSTNVSSNMNNLIGSSNRARRGKLPSPRQSTRRTNSKKCPENAESPSSLPHSTGETSSINDGLHLKNESIGSNSDGEHRETHQTLEREDLSHHQEKGNPSMKDQIHVLCKQVEAINFGRDMVK